MKRYEAESIASKLAMADFKEVTYVGLIKMIYDDIKNQTCKNCIDYNEDEDACFSDDVNKYREMKLNDADPTFGCNKWRAK